jgi:serine/threonine protein kinase
LSIERKVLEIVRDHTCIRQMIDDIESPPSLVLEYLDDNLLDVCSRKRLEGSDVKVVARTVLEALALLHDDGFVHTG